MGLPPEGIRQVHKSLPRLLNPDRGSQRGGETVSFKDWPWEVLKITFPTAWALPVEFSIAQLIRESSGAVPSYSKE